MLRVVIICIAYVYVLFCSINKRDFYNVLIFKSLLSVN